MTHRLLPYLTALIWAGLAGCYGRVARRQLAVLPFVAIAASTAALLSAAVTVQWSAAATWPAVLPLAAVMVASGIFGQFSMMLNGMAMGAAPRHGAITWALFQMAMVVPFLAATLSGREQARWPQWAALVGILLAFVYLSPKATEARDDKADLRGWFVLLLTAFICAGVSQTLAQEVSLRGWHDLLNLRTPVSLGAGAAGLWIVVLVRRHYPTRMHWLLGGLTGLLVAAGNLTLFAALDGYTALGQAYLVYPIAIGGSILLFTAYQLLAGHEALYPRKLWGLACGVLGLVVLSLK